MHGTRRAREASTVVGVPRLNIALSALVECYGELQELPRPRYKLSDSGSGTRMFLRTTAESFEDNPHQGWASEASVEHQVQLRGYQKMIESIVHAVQCCSVLTRIYNNLRL